MSSIQERQKNLVQQFMAFKDWEERYKKIIEMGKALPDLGEDLKTEEAKVRGCQSQVWLHAKLNPQGQVELLGDSDALIVKGLVAILLQVYSGSSPTEILKNPPQFLKEMGLESHLSPSRSNGLHAMIKQIQMFATAFAYLQQS